MDWVFLLSKVFDVHFNNITHNVVEHEKASSLLYFFLAHEIEDGGDDFVHSLNILYFWIESGKDEEYSSHVIIPVSYFLFLSTYNH